MVVRAVARGRHPTVVHVSTALEPAPADTDGDEDDVCHFFCCDPTVAWCGKPIDGVEGEPIDGPYEPDDCALCILSDESWPSNRVCKYCNPR